MEKRFHITIKNNETGEILNDIDTSCLIGAIDIGEGNTSIAFTHCNAISLVTTILAAKKAINNIYERNPHIKLLEMAYHASENRKEENENE